MKSIALALFFLVSLSALSQSDLTRQINTLMAQLRSGQSMTADREKILNTGNYKDATEALGKYVSDTVPAVRIAALSLYSSTALRSKDKALIRKSVKNILGNAVLNNSLNSQIVNLLKRYTKQDFESEELQLMKSLLNSEENNIGALAKVYAFAAGPAAQNDLKDWLAKPTLSKGDKKDLKLALVRSGDQNYAQKMIETLKQQVVNDELIYSALPDVLYTKNRDMVAFLLNAVMSDAKKCSSANNDDPVPMTCAYRLIEQLAPHILHFPVSINEKGEIDAKDLNQSLTEVRAWITKNKDSFELNTNTY